MAMISVVLPQCRPSSAIDPANPRSSLLSESELSNISREVLCYIYDNYIEPHSPATASKPPTSLTILGVGHAHMGIRQLLISRDCRHIITGIICFVSGSLKPVRSEIDLKLAAWYRNNSLIYINENHPIWSNDESVKMVHKMRYGDVFKAKGCNTINTMLGLFYPEATTFMARKIIAWEELIIPSLPDPDETEDEDMTDMGSS